MAEPDGAAIYGIWHCIVGACSQQKKRNGWLTADGDLAGSPWGVEDMALKFRRPQIEVERALQVLVSEKVGWIIVHGNSLLTADSPPAHLEEKEEKERREEKEGASRFTQPDMPTIKLQAAKIGLSDLEAEKFFNYYASNGWRVGKNPMKSWTHALSTWKINAQTYGNNGKNTLRDNPRNNGMSETAAKKSAETVEFMRRQNERKTNEPLPK